jgi:hypothetical protein
MFHHSLLFPESVLAQQLDGSEILHGAHVLAHFEQLWGLAE